ncbi:hypothetical protein E1A91_A05G111500v1 [Gossypium mustelinum]|uniref:Ripening-related protein grip22 n=1 Tax=Gossypium mustelinum TaxID=34275 RepID=A0A5D2Z6L6_GOSMU|nr:hypothetical protein E1A91_A05G111500v1 [Gossypium mustelinum]
MANLFSSYHLQQALICTNSKCNDDPNVGTHIRRRSSPAPLRGNCQPHALFESSTKAKLTINDFSQGGNGGDRSKCDEQSHDNSERIVALSTGWYDGGSRCGKMIRIMASNGKSVTAKVVDECDSMHGCDEAHAYQRPCNNKIIDGSNAVWSALKLNREKGIEDVT